MINQASDIGQIDITFNRPIHIPFSFATERSLGDIDGYDTDEDSPLLNTIKEKSTSKRSLQKGFKIVMKKAGLPIHYSIHTLCHTFASHLVMNGVDLPTVMKLMGHSDIQTTMIYAHLAPDHLADAVEKLGF